MPTHRIALFRFQHGTESVMAVDYAEKYSPDSLRISQIVAVELPPLTAADQAEILATIEAAKAREQELHRRNMERFQKQIADVAEIVPRENIVALMRPQAN